MSRQRDAQRGKLYAAERLHSGRSGPIMSPEEVKAYAYRVYLSDWWADQGFERQAGRPLSFLFPDKGESAWARRGRLQLSFPPWSRRPFVILHELAHLATPPISWENESEATRSHGPEFARIFLLMVSHWLGPEAAIELRRGFKKCGVKVAPRRLDVPAVKKVMMEGAAAASQRAPTNPEGC